MTGDVFRADVFCSGACGCSVSTVTNPVPLANLYRLQSVAIDSKKTVYSVSTVLGKIMNGWNFAFYFVGGSSTGNSASAIGCPIRKTSLSNYIVYFHV